MPDGPTRKRLRLRLRRDDHKSDALGALFLGVVTEDEGIRSALTRYFGDSVRIAEYRIADTCMDVEIDAIVFEAECQNLVGIGRRLLKAGQERSAARTFGEALQLDALSGDALRGRAKASCLFGDLTQARTDWVRAGEILGFDGGILRGLASVELDEGREASAIRYLEEAVRRDPADSDSSLALELLLERRKARFDG